MKTFEEIELKLKNMFQSGLSKIHEGHIYRKDPRKGDFRASGLSGECDRQIVLDSLLGYKSDIYTTLAAKGGNMIHTVIQLLLRMSGVISAEMIELETFLKVHEITITGHVDLLVVQMDNYHYVIDIKTNKSISQRSIDNNWIIKDSHKNQVCLYMASYMNKNGLKASQVRGGLWYLERTNNRVDLENVMDPNKWLIHVFDYDFMRFSELIIRGRNIMKKLHGGWLPVAKNSDFWLCKNVKTQCQYYNICHVKKLELLEEVENLMDPLCPTCRLNGFAHSCDMVVLEKEIYCCKHADRDPCKTCQEISNWLLSEVSHEN